MNGSGNRAKDPDFAIAKLDAIEVVMFISAPPGSADTVMSFPVMLVI